MTWIASQAYYKIQREVDGIEQRTIVHDRNMYLYRDRIVTRYREFAIEEVFDMSYRPMGAEMGIFYLHTKQGVYPYTVKEDPVVFIQAFKQFQSK
ncbi:hypothetical protein [Paenibacillus lutrae]|uniref:Bacterial Pleckstrin homology domain-containing protein n=1 Tax=Paenibacillus lutrae TaxID=2078573 RepID=A0A7X3FLE0_9BACL|nr:hypothetical protein [Paenibacillus lutrae]MVP01861.1 hypothetical protein [Paenibacillus lutrae]